MRPASLCAVAVLTIVLALSSSQIVLAAPAWSATSVSVVPGGSGASTVTVTRPNVEFTYVCMGLPFGATCYYASTMGTIDGHIDTSTVSPKTDRVTITTPSSIPTGAYHITLHATACAPDCDLLEDIGFTLFVGSPVGGFIESASTLALAAPWLAVIGVVGCVSILVVVGKKRR